jgi:hypothetical protein
LASASAADTLGQNAPGEGVQESSSGKLSRRADRALIPGPGLRGGPVWTGGRGVSGADWECKDDARDKELGTEGGFKAGAVKNARSAASTWYSQLIDEESDTDWDSVDLGSGTSDPVSSLGGRRKDDCMSRSCPSMSIRVSGKDGL